MAILNIFQKTTKARRLGGLSMMVAPYQCGAAALAISTSAAELPLKKQKKVRFCVSRYSYIEPKQREDGESSETSMLFYRPEDFDHIRVESREILRMMEMRSPIHEEQGLCARGLEDYTPIGARKRIWNQVRAHQAVIKEQIRQKERGVVDPERISRIYQRFAGQCRQKAYDAANKDAIDAREIQCRC